MNTFGNCVYNYLKLKVCTSRGLIVVLFLGILDSVYRLNILLQLECTWSSVLYTRHSLIAGMVISQGEGHVMRSKNFFFKGFAFPVDAEFGFD